MNVTVSAFFIYSFMERHQRENGGALQSGFSCPDGQFTS